MTQIFLSLLQLLAFLLFFYALAPRKGFSTPMGVYLHSMLVLMERISRFFCAALPLPPRIIALLLGLLATAARAGLLYKIGANGIICGSYMLYTFRLTSVLDWTLFTLLQLGFFYAAFLSANVFLRFWHFGRTLPCNTGDSLMQVCQPVSRLRLPVQLIVVVLFTMALVGVCQHYAADQQNLFVVASKAVKEVPQLAQVADVTDTTHLSAFANLLLQTAMEILSVVSTFSSYIVFLLIFSLTTLLFPNPRMQFFIAEMFALFQGRIPRIQLGPIVLTPLVVMVAFSVIQGLAFLIVFFFVKVLAHVV